MPTTATEKTCPKCSKVTAKGQKEIEKKFGLRRMGQGFYSQPWCRGCRATASVRSQQNKAAMKNGAHKQTIKKTAPKKSDSNRSAVLAEYKKAYPNDKNSRGVKYMQEKLARRSKRETKDYGV